jgi:hypothetical protein
MALTPIERVRKVYREQQEGRNKAYRTRATNPATESARLAAEMPALAAATDSKTSAIRG